MAAALMRARAGTKRRRRSAPARHATP
jgi:hypothetical protein